MNKFKNVIFFIIILSLISCNITKKTDNNFVYKVLYYSGNDFSHLNIIDSGYIKKTIYKKQITYNYYKKDSTINKYYFIKDTVNLLSFFKKTSYKENYFFQIDYCLYEVEKYEFIDSNSYDAEINYYFNKEYGLLVIYDVSWGLIESVKYKNNIFQNLLVDSVVNNIYYKNKILQPIKPEN